MKTKLLGDTKVGGLKIDVDTKDNVVTLTGTVHSAAEKTEAVRLAKTTTGVKSVVDNLTMSAEVLGEAFRNSPTHDQCANSHCLGVGSLAS